jgi:hypothetical protein
LKGGYAGGRRDVQHEEEITNAYKYFTVIPGKKRELVVHGRTLLNGF